MFLTRDEVKELTGAKQKRRVMAWLDQNGYRYDLAYDGWPRVLRAVVEERLGVKSSAPKRAAPGPDLGWIK